MVAAPRSFCLVSVLVLALACDDDGSPDGPIDHGEGGIGGDGAAGTAGRGTAGSSGSAGGAGSAGRAGSSGATAGSAGTMMPMDAAVPDAAADAAADAQADAGAPMLPMALSATGLYVAGSTEELAPGVHPYDPRYVLWADESDKKRFLYLPEGTQIDTSDMDDWQFPVGTKVWKEFGRGGKRLETRLLSKTESGWLRVAYVWNDAETDAVAAPRGATDVRGTEHDVPQRGDCDTCHDGRTDTLLGVSAIQLAHEGSGTTLASLMAAGLLTDPPASSLALPDTPEWNALGYLHANCGNCHNPKSIIWDRVDLELWLKASELGNASTTRSYLSTVGVDVTESAGALTKRVVAGEPESSVLIERMTTRGSDLAMPPLASEHVDDDGVALISAWIEGL